MRMNERVYRIQDQDGRGPWKPGFSVRWAEDRPEHDELLPWYVTMGDVHKQAIVGMYMGSACVSLEQLRRWFTEREYRALLAFGYQAVSMEIGRILGVDANQVVFERAKPLNENVRHEQLYAQVFA